MTQFNVYIPGTTMFAHSSCTSLFILLFIKSTVYCIAHFISLHILPPIFFIFYYSYLYLYMFSCVMFHFFYLLLFLPIFIYILLCCLIFIFLHCPLSGLVLIYISLLIISCIIEYVTNKRTLNPKTQTLKSE